MTGHEVNGYVPFDISLANCYYYYYVIILPPPQVMFLSCVRGLTLCVIWVLAISFVFFASISWSLLTWLLNIKHWCYLIRYFPCFHCCMFICACAFFISYNSPSLKAKPSSVITIEFIMLILPVKLCELFFWVGVISTQLQQQLHT